MKINAIVARKNSPAGWYRIGALKGLLSTKGIDVNEIIPRVPSIPPSEKLKRPVWLVSAVLERITFIRKLRGSEATILQRELISTLPTVERFLPGKIILDVDDAIFLKKRGWAAKNAARASVGVVCGNNYLADYFSKYNRNIRVIPTGVNVTDMKVDPFRLAGEQKKIIGWIGTPGNLIFFEKIIPALKSLLEGQRDKVEMRIVTSHAGAIPVALRPYCKFVKWYPGVEFEELPKWSVGLMPLADTEWTKGKCSFKMLQYMSAGIPVVASPVGMNIEVLEKGDIGFGVSSANAWYNAIKSLIVDKELNLEMGKKAREVAVRDFSLETVVEEWVRVLDEWL